MSQTAAIDKKIDEAEKRAKEFLDKAKQLKAKRDLNEAKKLQTLIKGQRSDDTRRKILAGALVLNMMESDETTRTKFLERLDKYLKRADERLLFNLPPVTAPSES